MRVKICGTATFADLDCAVAAGADAVGFLMGITHVTQDAVTPETAAAMVATLPPFIVPVAVTHLTKPSDLIRIVGVGPLYNIADSGCGNSGGYCRGSRGTAISSDHEGCTRDG